MQLRLWYRQEPFVTLFRIEYLSGSCEGIQRIAHVRVCVCVSTNMSNAAFYQRQSSKCRRCINAVVVVAVAVGWICCVRFHCQFCCLYTQHLNHADSHTQTCRYDTTHNSHSQTQTHSSIHWSNATCVLYSLCILDVSSFISIVLHLYSAVWLCVIVCLYYTHKTN